MLEITLNLKIIRYAWACKFRKRGELEGVCLDDRYVGGVPVYLEGKAPIERILEIYERRYEHFRLRLEEILGLRAWILEQDLLSDTYEGSY